MLEIDRLDITKGDIKDILKSCAKAQWISVIEFKGDLQNTIIEKKYSDDSEIRINFKKYFGTKTPPPEEYVYMILKHSKINF